MKKHFLCALLPRTLAPQKSLIMWQARRTLTHDSKYDWVFEGIHDNVIGDFGFSGGGADGFELDRVDRQLDFRCFSPSQEKSTSRLRRGSQAWSMQKRSRHSQTLDLNGNSQYMSLGRTLEAKHHGRRSPRLRCLLVIKILSQLQISLSMRKRLPPHHVQFPKLL